MEAKWKKRTSHKDMFTGLATWKITTEMKNYLRGGEDPPADPGKTPPPPPPPPPPVG